MEQIITLCGDNCSVCPRYTAKTSEELHQTAILWYKVGLRSEIISIDEIKCDGCSSHKSCTYGLRECVEEKGIQNCMECLDFFCIKINLMFETTKQLKKRLKKICTETEFVILKAAFCEKETNLKKLK